MVYMTIAIEPDSPQDDPHRIYLVSVSVDDEAEKPTPAVWAACKRLVEPLLAAELHNLDVKPWRPGRSGTSCPTSPACPAHVLLRAVKAMRAKRRKRYMERRGA